ncbi:MAG: universal stress protein, partial [Solirubrobacteraceae bacterium]
GYDGSPESERALAAARELAAALHAKLSAFEAIALPNYVFVGSPEALERPLHATLGNARARIAALHAEPHAAYGRAPAELEVYGASLDLLVVGSHGYGPFARLVHGSTSQKLARTLRCPLLVITPQQRA